MIALGALGDMYVGIHIIGNGCVTDVGFEHGPKILTVALNVLLACCSPYYICTLGWKDLDQTFVRLQVFSCTFDVPLRHRQNISKKLLPTFESGSSAQTSGAAEGMVKLQLHLSAFKWSGRTNFTVAFERPGGFRNFVARFCSLPSGNSLDKIADTNSKEAWAGAR